MCSSPQPASLSRVKYLPGMARHPQAWDQLLGGDWACLNPVWDWPSEASGSWAAKFSLMPLFSDSDASKLSLLNKKAGGNVVIWSGLWDTCFGCFRVVDLKQWPLFVCFPKLRLYSSLPYLPQTWPGEGGGEGQGWAQHTHPCCRIPFSSNCYRISHTKSPYKTKKKSACLCILVSVTCRAPLAWL